MEPSGCEVSGLQERLTRHTVALRKPFFRNARSMRPQESCYCLDWELFSANSLRVGSGATTYRLLVNARLTNLTSSQTFLCSHRENSSGETYGGWSSA